MTYSKFKFVEVNRIALNLILFQKYFWHYYEIEKLIEFEMRTNQNCMHIILHCTLPMTKFMNLSNFERCRTVK